MISTVFAPNETASDMWSAVWGMLQPWTWITGKAVSRLRMRLKKRFFWDTAEIHFTYTARAAIYHFLKAHNLPKGSQVLVQGFTCAAVILPITAQDLKPVFIDIHETDFSMDFEDLKKKYTPDAKVLILQHSFGIPPVDRTKIIQFAKEKKLILLEDLAHGFDTELYKDKSQYGSLLLSFGRSKAISSVFGGALVSRYPKVDGYFKAQEKQIRYPSHWTVFKLILYKCFAPVIKVSYKLYIGRVLHYMFITSNLFEAEISKKEKTGQYDFYFSKALPNICAQFVLNQLQRYNDVIEQQKRNSAYYAAELDQPSAYKKALLRFPFITESKDIILKKMAQKGILLGTWYDQVIAPAGINERHLEYKYGSCPVAESISKKTLNLPTFVTKKQAEYIVRSIKSI